MPTKKLKLTDERLTYKPFHYPWAFEAFEASEAMHWRVQEVPMIEDIKDWKTKLNDGEKVFLTNVFRFFTQGDIDVAGAYVNNYLPVFPHPEIRMMLTSFAARESVHISAYSHLIETLGMPETVYNEFLQYKEMRDKHDFIASFINQDKNTIAQQIAAFSAFTEGMQLFSSFVMLLNFPRHGTMKGMGQIIAWSIADEAVIAGTEVLTEDGWICIEDLNLSDKVYQYDMQTKLTSFVNPQKIQCVERDHSYVFESDVIHQHVSPNHRMIVMNDDGSVGEFKAHECPEDATLIVSGQAVTGDDILTDEDKLSIIMIIRGDLTVDWIYNKIPFVSSEWAKSAVEYYLEHATVT